MSYATIKKYGPMDPEFYTNIINKFGTEENKEKAKTMITKQYLECNFYRTRICDAVFNKEKTDSDIRSYRAKSNWVISDPDDNSNWIATNKTNGKKEYFRLCKNDLCKDAHNHSSIRKAKCIFNVFGVCDKGSKCTFVHSEFNSNESNIPLCSGKEFRKNGQKVFKVFFYLNSIRIFKYSGKDVSCASVARNKQSERTFVLNIDNAYLTESETNTKSVIQNRLQIFFDLLTIYYEQLETIFNDKNEVSITEFLDSIVKNILEEVIRNASLFEIFDIIFNNYMSDTVFVSKIEHLVEYSKNKKTYFDFISNLIQRKNLLPAFYNNIINYQNYCNQKGNEMFNLLHSDTYYEKIKPYINTMIGMWLENFNSYILPALQDEKFLIDIINESLQLLEVDLRLNYRCVEIKQVESIDSNNDEIIPREYSVISPIKDLENNNHEIKVESDNVHTQVDTNDKIKDKSDNIQTDILESKSKTKFLISFEIEISCQSLLEYKNIGKQLQAIKGIKVPQDLFE